MYVESLGGFARANHPHRAFLEGNVRRDQANRRVDDLDFHALVFGKQALHLPLDGLPSLEPLARRADPLGVLGPMVGDGLGVAAVVGVDVRFDGGPNGGEVFSSLALV